MTPMDRQAAAVGRKVLDGFSRGRTLINQERKARSAERAVQVFYLARIDSDAGRPGRGRSGRIRRKMGGLLSESQVRRLLKSHEKISAHAVQSARFLGVV